MFICVTEVDAVTKIPCTVEPQRTGPSMPNIKGLNIDWADQSTWPIELDSSGTYTRTPRYYGTCDDDADVSIAGVLEVLTEQEYLHLKEIEFLARKPFPSWIWDQFTNNWVPPFPRPADAIINGGNTAYRWDEPTISWVPLEMPGMPKQG